MKKISEDQSQQQPSTLPKWKQTANKLFAGAAAGVGATAAIYPLDYVGDVQKSWRTAAKGVGEVERQRALSKSFVSTAKEIYQHHGGVKGFYAGAGSKLVKVAPAMALTFALNDVISKKLDHTEKTAGTYTIDEHPTEVDPKELENTIKDHFYHKKTKTNYVQLADDKFYKINLKSSSSVKTAARSTYPLARYSMLPIPIPNATFDNAMIGRMNQGGAGLYPMEREIAQTLETTPDSKPHTFARFTTNPFGAAVIGTATSLANEYAKKKAHRTLARALGENPKTPMGAQLKEVLKYLMRYDEPGFAERAKAVQDVTKSQMFGRALKSGLFLGGAALAGRLIYPYAIKGQVNKEINAYEGGNPAAFIRTKLREDGMKTAEFPVALLDDAVIQGNRLYMAALAAQTKKDKPVEKKANVLLEAAHLGERAKNILDKNILDKKSKLMKTADSFDAIGKEYAAIKLKEQELGQRHKALMGGHKPTGWSMYNNKGVRIADGKTEGEAVAAAMDKQATLETSPTFRKVVATAMLGSAGVGAGERAIETGIRLAGVPQKDKMIQMAHKARIDSLAQRYKLTQATSDTLGTFMKKAK